jgi:hypothetical protein
MAGGSTLTSPLPPLTWAGVVRNGHPATSQGSDPSSSSSVQQGPSHATILQQMFQSCVARDIAARLEFKRVHGAVETRLVCQTSTAASTPRKQGRQRPANQRRRQNSEEWLLRKKSMQIAASTTAGAEAAKAATAAKAVDQRSPAVKEPATVSDQPAALTAATELPRAPSTRAPQTPAPPITAPHTPAPPTPASSSLDQPTPAPPTPAPAQPTPAPPTPAPAQPTPAPPTPGPPTPAPAPPSPAPPTPAPPTPALPTPSPPNPPPGQVLCFKCKMRNRHRGVTPGVISAMLNTHFYIYIYFSP